MLYSRMRCNTRNERKLHQSRPTRRLINKLYKNPKIIDNLILLPYFRYVPELNT